MKLNRLTAAAACLVAALNTHAALVGTDAAGDNGGFGVGFSFAPDVNVVIAQQFTIGTSAATVGGITVWMNQNNTAPPGQFTLQVMDAIGPAATAADVLLTLTGTFPNTPNGGHLLVSFSGLGLALAGNTDYYLVISSAAGPDTGWGTSSTDLAGTPGSVGSSFVGLGFNTSLADYRYLDPNNPNPAHTMFRIDEVAVAGVPEPSSTLLLGLGIAAAATVRRRQAAGT